MSEKQDTMKKEAAPAEAGGAFAPVQRGEYWTSVIILLFVAAFFITVAAVCYGIIVTPPGSGGAAPRIAFPWIGWFAAMLVSPALILGFAQYVAGKHSPQEGEADGREKAWAGQLSGRALRVYRFIKDAPLFMVCLALIALGATLLIIDGAFALFRNVLLELIPYAPYFIGGITAFAIAIAALMAYFRHANNKLMADYAFRREVLEKTGVILLDEKGKAILPPGGDRDRYAIGSISQATADDGPVLEATPVRALPQGEDGNGNNSNSKSNMP